MINFITQYRMKTRTLVFKLNVFIIRDKIDSQRSQGYQGQLSCHCPKYISIQLSK